MPFQGPIVIVAKDPNAALGAALRANGGTPIDASWARAGDAVRKSWPAAVLIDDDAGSAQEIESLSRALAVMREPYLPVLARVGAHDGPVLPGVLPISASATGERVAARLASALRVRTLDATVFRRAALLVAEGGKPPQHAATDPLDDATVLVVGRGRSYPEFTTAVGQRLGLIGAMNVEIAARYLTARPVDGILIGEGLSPGMPDALVKALAQDQRFRDLPLAVAESVPLAADPTMLPNFERLDGSPAEIVDWMLPLVRLHAQEARLQRQLAAIEAPGMLDPQTGLFTIVAFLRDLNRAIEEAARGKYDMTLARFSFLPFIDRRTNLDAAWLVSKLVRSVDFACHASDGSILLAFPNTALRDAHVIARRIATSLKGTMLGPDNKLNDPIVTIAARKPSDTADSLLARVSEPLKVAAE